MKKYKEMGFDRKDAIKNANLDASYVGATKLTEKELIKIASDYAYATSSDLDRATYRLLDPDYTKTLLPKYKKAIKEFEMRSKTKLSGWKKGSTKFVEAGEKRPKRNGVLVTRKKSGANKGSFSKFRTVSGIGATDETKRLKQLATQSKSPLFKKVASILISDAKGYGSLKSLIEDVLQFGLQSGMITQLMYYKDTLAWYKKYKKEIAMMLRDTMSEMGVDSPKDVFGRNWDNEDPFAEDTQNQNLLAWYSFEETARNIGYSLGYEI
jgi:hypothetical protein